MRETLAAAGEEAATAAAPAHGGTPEAQEGVERQEEEADAESKEHLGKAAEAREGPRQQQESSSLLPSSLPPARSGGGGSGGHGSIAGVNLSVLHVHLDMPPPSSGPPPRPGSVQRLLEKEGPDARNVVSWLVPNHTNGGGGSGGRGGGGGGVMDVRGQAVEGAGGVVAGGGMAAPQQQQQHRHRGASREGSREREHYSR